MRCPCFLSASTSSSRARSTRPAATSAQNSATTARACASWRSGEQAPAAQASAHRAARNGRHHGSMQTPSAGRPTDLIPSRRRGSPDAGASRTASGKTRPAAAHPAIVAAVSRPSADPSAVARAVQERLKRAIPEPRCELDHRSPWELLVATILSAQSTDATVNKVTPELFARWPTPLALAEADPAEVEAVVRPTGFFRNKTRLIQGAARTLVAEFGGKVPQTMDDLLRVPGVARKTANVVLGVAYRVAAGIVVDTHVQR